MFFYYDICLNSNCPTDFSGSLIEPVFFFFPFFLVDFTLSGVLSGVDADASLGCGCGDGVLDDDCERKCVPSV